MTNNSDLIEVGKVIRLFHEKGCIAIRVGKSGLRKGDHLVLESTRAKNQTLRVTADSIQINHKNVDIVQPGTVCAISVPQSPDIPENFPHNGMTVFRDEDAKKGHGPYFAR